MIGRRLFLTGTAVSAASLVVPSVPTKVLSSNPYIVPIFDAFQQWRKDGYIALLDADTRLGLYRIALHDGMNFDIRRHRIWNSWDGYKSTEELTYGLAVSVTSHGHEYLFKPMIKTSIPGWREMEEPEHNIRLACLSYAEAKHRPEAEFFIPKEWLRGLEKRA